MSDADAPRETLERPAARPIAPAPLPGLEASPEPELPARLRRRAHEVTIEDAMRIFRDVQDGRYRR